MGVRSGVLSIAMDLGFYTSALLISWNMVVHQLCSMLNSYACFEVVIGVKSSFLHMISWDFSQSCT